MPDMVPNDGDFPEEWNTDIYPDLATAQTVWEMLGEWAGGNGFGQEQWFDMITEIRGYHEYIDEDGNFHGGFEFDFEYQGEYGGTRMVSW